MTVTDAIAVAAQIARDHGLEVHDPVPLRSTNNAVAWLAPTEVVAKVGVGHHSRLDTELQVAKELAGMGAPVVFPAAELPAIVHSRSGLDVTFWRYHPQPAEPGDLPIEAIAPALRCLHRALAHISSALKESIPTLDHELGYVRSLLTNPDKLAALSTRDRSLLVTTFERLKAELDVLGHPDESTVIHGSPHSYNLLLVDGEPRFIDFETVCKGPVEWDLAHLDEGAEAFYGDTVHPRLLWVCSGMVSVKTATLCWAEVDRGDLRDHAEWHLSHIKTSIAPLV
jgi:hypothetical protein